MVCFVTRGKRSNHLELDETLLKVYFYLRIEVSTGLSSVADSAGYQ